MDANTFDQPLDRGSQQGMLLDLPEGDPMPVKEREAGGGAPRLKRADRRQIVCLPHALDDLLPEDHEARIIWVYVEGLDLRPLHDAILAVEGHAGRSAADRKIFMALWLFATLKGVGSARQLAELCERHVAYRWICGGVSVNHHTLSDFRTAHGELLDRLLTQGVAGLMHEGLVEMERVAQDGMRVRASAGAASFRRRETLQTCLAAAEEQVQRLRVELATDPAAGTQRQKAARQRAARERLERVQKALEHLPELEARKKPKDREKTRVSTTDAEATVMKMADGGYRPAYNVQLATDTATQIITGVEVVTTGGRHAGLRPGDGVQRSPTRPPYALRRRQCGGGRVASADGHAGSQRGLQGTCGHGGVRQRDCPKSEPATVPSAQSNQGSNDRPVVCAGSQLDACGGAARRGGQGGPISHKKERAGDLGTLSAQRFGSGREISLADHAEPQTKLSGHAAP